MEKLFISDDVKSLLDQGNQYAIDAMNIFKWQSTDKVMMTTDLVCSNYCILTYKEYTNYFNHILIKDITSGFWVRTVDHRFYLIFEDDNEIYTAMDEIYPESKFIWNRFYDKGYEVTSRGDRRFSPFFMKIINLASGQLRTLEDFYHLNLKGLEDETHTSWRDCKGLPPKDGYGEVLEMKCTNMYKEYLNRYPGLLYELSVIGGIKVFTDMFGTTNNSQARYYCDILNDYYGLE